MKVCSKCLAEKPVTDFGLHAREKDGLRRCCKTCNVAAAAEYAALNGEKVRANQAAYYEANKELLIERSRARYAANKEEISVVKAAYRKAKPEVARRLNANRRARRNASGGSLSRGIVQKLLQLQKYKCVNCRSDLRKVGSHIDHIDPISRGGANIDSNVQLLCPPCNLSKHNKEPLTWAQMNGRLM